MVVDVCKIIDKNNLKTLKIKEKIVEILITKILLIKNDENNNEISLFWKI